MKPKAPYARCEGCPLAGQPFVPPQYAQGGTNLVVVGEAPGREEVRERKPFMGMSGGLLKMCFISSGINPEKVHYTNAVLCHPEGNSNPPVEAIEACNERLGREINEIPGEPHIMTVGNFGTGAVLGQQMPKSITAARGMWFSVDDHWVFPTFHPAYVLRKPDQGMTFMRDLKKLVQGPGVRRELRRPYSMLDMSSWVWYTMNDHFHMIPLEMGPDDDPFEMDYVQVVSSEMELKVALDDLSKSEWIAFDFETTQHNWWKDDAMMLALCSESAWVIVPGRHPEVKPEHNLLENPECVEMLNEFWRSNKGKFVGHNAKFDMQFGYNLGITEMDVHFDTLLAHYALDERKGTHGLKDLGREYFDILDYDHELVHRYLKSKKDNWSKAPFLMLAMYASWDVAITLGLRKILYDEMIADNVYEWPFMNLLMVKNKSYFQMERVGTPVDVEYLRKVDVLLVRERDEYLEAMREMLGDEMFNPRSHDQISHAVWEVMKVPQSKTHKWNLQKGKVKMKLGSTSKEALEHLAVKNEKGDIIGYTDKFVDLLFKYRRTDKIRGSYAKNLLEGADQNGRVHPTIFQHGTETGRISMRGPALQTLPREGRDRYGALIRASIVAPPGYKLAICDYSQAELRGFTVLTQDPFLLKVYREGRDLHDEVATAMFGKGWTKEQRMIVKKFNFGWIYGAGFAALQDSDMPVEVARKFLKEYKANMGVATKWREERAAFMAQEGYTVSPFGRKRRFPIITDANRIDAEHSSYNQPVQSMASDLTGLAAMELQNLGYEAILEVHDSVLVLFPDTMSDDDICKVVAGAMSSVGEKYFPDIPWKADSEVACRWVEIPQWVIDAHVSPEEMYPPENEELPPSWEWDEELDGEGYDD